MTANRNINQYPILPTTGNIGQYPIPQYQYNSNPIRTHERYRRIDKQRVLQALSKKSTVQQAVDPVNDVKYVKNKSLKLQPV